MRLDDTYLGRITPDEAREAHSHAERDCEHMPSAAWRALHAVGQMRYEYAVQVLLSDGAGGNVWHFADEDSMPFGSLKPYGARWYTKKEAQEIRDAEVDCFGNKDIRIVRRLVGESEAVE